MASIELQQVFLRAWWEFLGQIEWLGIRKLQQRGGLYHEKLSPLLSEVLRELQSEAAGHDFHHALALANEDGDEEVLSYLTRELEFFNHLVETLRSTDAGDHEDKESDDVIGAGKSIKDSVEDWLKKRLPERWKKLLKIVNEILSIAKVG